MKTTHSKEIVTDKNLVAYCGLYCGACRSYLSGKCPGCKENVKATWCKIRSCCQENLFASCADCTAIDLKECKKYNSLISKIIGIVLNSDRSACIEKIRVVGYDQFATEMAKAGKQTLRRK